MIFKLSLLSKKKTNSNILITKVLLSEIKKDFFQQILKIDNKEPFFAIKKINKKEMY